jgi:hypothetical protein
MSAKKRTIDQVFKSFLLYCTINKTTSENPARQYSLAIAPIEYPQIKNLQKPKSGGGSEEKLRMRPDNKNPPVKMATSSPAKRRLIKNILTSLATDLVTQIAEMMRTFNENIIIIAINSKTRKTPKLGPARL